MMAVIDSSRRIADTDRKILEDLVKKGFSIFFHTFSEYNTLVSDYNRTHKVQPKFPKIEESLYVHNLDLSLPAKSNQISTLKIIPDEIPPELQKLHHLESLSFHELPFKEFSHIPSGISELIFSACPFSSFIDIAASLIMMGCKILWRIPPKLKL